MVAKGLCSKGKQWHLGRVAILILVVTLMPYLALAPSVAASKCQQDFTITISPTSATITAGSTLVLNNNYPGQGVSVTSVCGFTGTIHVSASVSPTLNNGPTTQLSRYDLAISPTFPTSSAKLTIATQTTTPLGTYTIIITGRNVLSGPLYGLTHTTSLSLTVTT